jgi:magnesium transporter
MTTVLSEHNLDEPIARHVRRDFTVLRADQSVAQALAEVRAGQVGEKIIYFYVVEDQNRLVGVVPTRRLLMSTPDVPIRRIMIDRVISIPARASVLEACKFFVMHRLLAFPVVDEQEQIIGVVDVGLFTEELLNVTEREAAEDLFQLIGIHVAQGRRGSAWAGFRDRFPWLLANIGGGILAAFIVGMYEQFMNVWIVLALFIPVVLALAESVSIQSMTITLQGFRTQRVDWRMILRALRAELKTAVLLGAGAGLLVGLVAWIWRGQAGVSLAIALSICLSMMTACLLGVVLPTVIRIFRGDPRIASGPIVLASADVITLLFYFNLSAMLLPRV